MNKPAGKNDSELRAMSQVQLLDDLPVPGEVAVAALGTAECLCDQVVKAVNIEDLPHPPVNPATGEMALAAVASAM